MLKCYNFMKFKLYEIRLLKVGELDKFQQFINDYWKKDHILAKSKVMFEFQHSSGHDGEYDFVVAVHKETDEIHGVLGFINSSIYDGSNPLSPNSIGGALWKVRDDVDNKEVKKIGLEMLFYLLKKYPNSPYITAGLSKYSQAIYKSMRMNFERMNHYYIANKEIKEFKICVEPRFSSGVEISNTTLTWLNLADIQCIESDYYPFKNKDYIEGRFEKHPFYHYLYLGVYVNDILECIWIVRKIDIDNSSCLRIVDMIGNTSLSENIVTPITNILRKENIEYIDCYNAGIDAEIFKGLGFNLVEGETIIPNYSFSRILMFIVHLCIRKKL